MAHIIDPVYYQDYILAGKPEFVIASTKNQVQETFVVYKDRYSSKWRVKNRVRETIGYINHLENDLYVFERVNYKLIANQEKQVEQFAWFWSRFLMSSIPPWIEVRYDARCAHCRRPLTHPESIPIGIGPDCFVKLGLTHKTLILSQHKF